MANPLLRIAKSGSKWTPSDLDAYDVQINTIDTQAFFGVPHLPAPMVDTVILNHVNAPVGLSLPHDICLFFHYLHHVTTCKSGEQRAAMSDFSFQLMSRILKLDGSSRWIHRRDGLHFIMSGKRVGAVLGISMRDSESHILLVELERERVSFPLLPQPHIPDVYEEPICSKTSRASASSQGSSSIFH
jgi:hypothetical protein